MSLPEPLLRADWPRERLLRHGAATLSDPELLALALRTGVAGCNAVQLGHDLLRRFGGLRGLLGTSPAELQVVPGLGTAKACVLAAVLELARRTLEEDLVRRYCQAALGHRKVEHCIALYLDARLKLIICAEVARGTLTQAQIYPREIVREALRHHAAALILTHNHPGGTAAASAADIAMTRQIRQALALIDVRLIDHVIVAGAATVSMAAQGHL
ncbi:DNA repair protein [Bordetella pertussis]|nr:DNA repair protein [Bordetella pertussis]